MYYHDYSTMSCGITQRVLKKELQYDLAHSALVSLEKNKQCNPILQTKHNIKTQTFANKCTQVNAFHSQYSTEQLQHVQKVTFVSRKIQTVCTQLKIGQAQILNVVQFLPTKSLRFITCSEVDQNGLIS